MDAQRTLDRCESQQQQRTQSLVLVLQQQQQQQRRKRRRGLRLQQVVARMGRQEPTLRYGERSKQLIALFFLYPTKFQHVPIIPLS